MRILSLLFASIISIYALDMGFSDEVANFIKKNNLHVVDFDYVKKALKNKNSIFIDSRIEKRYNTKTIPTSINIPPREYNKPFYELKNIDKNREIIVFCDGKACNKSTKVAVILKKRGYKNIKVYQNGMPEWEIRDYSKINNFYMNRILKDECAFVVLDLRDKKEFNKSHIKHSISIANNDLAGNIPINKLAPIVIISKKNDKNIYIVAEKLISMGYHNIGIYTDGYKTWQKIKNKELNKIPSKKIFEPYIGGIKKGKDVGTVDSEWFLKNYKKLPPNTTLIDVRERSERLKGFINGSKQISVGENLPKDFIAKLPKDRYIIFYCERGNRSYDAYQAIQDSGLSWAHKVLYLDAIVKCKKSKCTIKPNEPTNPTIW